jgi:hypothetical protein
MINDPFHPEEAIAREKDSTRRMLLGVVCALAVTAILLAGYAFIRRFHAQQILANQTPPPVIETGPKGPAVAHILVDEPLLARGVTTIGGVVKNISQGQLSGLAIDLQLNRRNGEKEQKLVPVGPVTLQPQEEGTYTLKLPASEYSSVTLVGLRADPEAKQIAFTKSPGKQRPPERLQPKTVVVRKSDKPGEFLNTPDNPGRVP